jgi:hypothetical protein
LDIEQPIKGLRIFELVLLCLQLIDWSPSSHDNNIHNEHTLGKHQENACFTSLKQKQTAQAVREETIIDHDSIGYATVTADSSLRVAADDDDDEWLLCPIPTSFQKHHSHVVCHRI